MCIRDSFLTGHTVALDRCRRAAHDVTAAGVSREIALEYETVVGGGGLHGIGEGAIGYELHRARDVAELYVEIDQDRVERRQPRKTDCEVGSDRRLAHAPLRGDNRDDTARLRTGGQIGHPHRYSRVPAVRGDLSRSRSRAAHLVRFGI